MRPPKLIQYRDATYRRVSADKLPRLPSPIRKQVSTQIGRLVDRIRDDIPLSDIAEVLRKNGLVMLQEDDTEWSGILTGWDGQVLIPLATTNQVTPDGRYLEKLDHGLSLSWHKYDTGRYDVTAYISL
jgi:hypothetical protein